VSGQFLYWHELTAAQIASLATHAVVLVPIGATEQHGPHLATGTDTILADAILKDLHRTPPSSGVFLRLPTLPIGASDHHVSFGGTLSLPPLLFCEVLVAQLRCLAAQGHKRILLFNSHGGNIAPMQTALAEVAVELHMQQIVAGGLSYWQLAQSDWKEIPELTGRSLSHACEFETSMMYFARPDLQRVPPPARYVWRDTIDERCSLALPFAASTPTGAFGDPAIATAEIGEKLVGRAADALRIFLADFAVYRPTPESTRGTASA
jgi:creatinine amidohydrolase